VAEVVERGVPSQLEHGQLQEVRVARVGGGVGPEEHGLLRHHELVVELQPVERELELERGGGALYPEVQRLGGEVEELLGRVVDKGEAEPRHVEQELLLGDRLLLDEGDLGCE